MQALMTEGFLKPQPTSGRKPKYGLIFQVVLLLGFAICLRLFFFTGPIYEESYATLKRGYELTIIVQENIQAGRLFELLEIPSRVGLRKLSSYAPVSVFYLVAGVSDYASIGFALASSLLNLISLFLIVRVWHGTKVALVSLFLWAFIPQEIILATVPRLNTISLPLLSGSLFVFVLGFEKQQRHLVGAGVFLGLLLMVSNNILGGYLLALVTTYFFWRRGYFKIIWYGLLCLAIALVFLYGSNALLVGYRTLAESMGGLQLIVILIIVITTTRSSKNKPESYDVIGLSLTFLFLVIHQQTMSRLQFSYEIEIYIWVISMLIMAQYIALLLEARTIKRFLVIAAPLILLLVVIIDKTQGTLIPNYGDLEHVGSTLFLTLKILASVTILAAIVSPLFFMSASRMGVGVALVLLASFALSLLPGIWGKKLTQPYQLSNMHEIMDTLQNQYIDLPIYVNEPQLFNLLHYTSKFDENLQVLTFEKKTQISNGFVVVREGSLADIPSDWVYIKVVGKLGHPRLVIFRTLQADFAQTELAISVGSAEESITRFNLQRLYRAYMNVDEHCAAYYAWLRAEKSGDSDTFEYLIIEPHSACFVYSKNEDLFSKLFQSNEGNSFSESGVVYSNQIRVRALDDLDSVRIFHWNKFYPDSRIFDIEIILEPGKFYLYEATIRSQALVTSLYWAAGGEEFAALIDDFPEWRQVSILMATPNWAEPTGVKLSPVLFDHFAFVDLKNAHLIEIDEINYSFDLP